MTDAETAEPPAAAPVALPTDTTPTWEIELLISGALAFGAIQLPGYFDDWLVQWIPRLTEGMLLPAIMGYVFLKSLATTLALTFGLHIVLRGFWAASLGLHSVYPEGIQWDNVKTGPIFREVTRAAVPSLPVYVSRLDNTSSLVFALGALLLMLSALSSVFAVLAIGVTYVVSRAMGGELRPFVGAAIAFAAIVLPGVIAGFVDKKRGAELRPGSRARRVMERMARYSITLGGTRIAGPMMLVFTSRQGQTKGTAILLAVLYGVFGLVFAQVALRLEFFDLNTYQFLPASGEGVGRSAYYASQRTGATGYSTIPFIDHDVIEDQVLRVFVPYRMRRFDEVLKAKCPSAAQSKATDTSAAENRARRVLDCFVPMLNPQIDGAAVDGVASWLGTDPVSSQRGFVLMVPLRGLADGAHLLTLTEIPRVDRPAKPTPDRYTIPFYYSPR
ncbi:MAG: hypothetical protein SFW08_02815 [Gemmatimonadaceae bacterium]|nr:hypothetical protein [Gemmatimonadaceae bacterium]